MTLYFEERMLDISKGDKSELDGVVDPIRLRRQEGGSDSIGIIGVIYDGDKPYNATGASVTFKMLNPAGQYVDTPGSVQDGASGIVSVVVDSNMTAVAGDVQIAYFQLIQNGNVVTTNNIPLIVMSDNDLTAQRADEYRTEVEKLVEYLVQLKANFKDIASLSFAYQAGSSPTSVPTGSWSSSMVTVGQGWYLWTRITVNYSNGTSQVFYSKAYQGKDNADFGAATTTKDGLMSASDKKNLDELKSAWDSATFLGIVPQSYWLSEGDDLNTYNKAGVYACTNSNTAATILNRPSFMANIGFKLYVEYTLGSSARYVRQTISAYDRTNVRGTRFSSDSGAGWSEWTQL